MLCVFVSKVLLTSIFRFGVVVLVVVAMVVVVVVVGRGGGVGVAVQFKMVSKRSGTPIFVATRLSAVWAQCCLREGSHAGLMPMAMALPRAFNEYSQAVSDVYENSVNKSNAFQSRQASQGRCELPELLPCQRVTQNYSHAKDCTRTFVAITTIYIHAYIHTYIHTYILGGKIVLKNSTSKHKQVRCTIGGDSINHLTFKDDAEKCRKNVNESEMQKL